jgi:hypothetical protein
MAKVVVSLPDDLLGALDAEAKRRHTSRSAILQTGARRSAGFYAATVTPCSASSMSFPVGGPVHSTPRNSYAPSGFKTP